MKKLFHKGLSVLTAVSMLFGMQGLGDLDVGAVDVYQKNMLAATLGQTCWTPIATTAASRITTTFC